LRIVSETRCRKDVWERGVKGKKERKMRVWNLSLFKKNDPPLERSRLVLHTSRKSLNPLAANKGDARSCEWGIRREREEDGPFNGTGGLRDRVQRRGLVM